MLWAPIIEFCSLTPSAGNSQCIHAPAYNRDLATVYSLAPLLVTYSATAAYKERVVGVPLSGSPAGSSQHPQRSDYNSRRALLPRSDWLSWKGAPRLAGGSSPQLGTLRRRPSCQ